MENSRSTSSMFSDNHPIMSSDRNVEKEICTFYVQILQKMFKVSPQKFADVRKSLTNIRSYKNLAVEEHDIVSFDAADRLAYTFAYCVIHSVVMYDRLFGMLKANPSMLKSMVSMKKIRFCFLGGGPGFEASSVCKLLSNILISCINSDQQPLQLHVTIIDVCESWGKDAELIMSSIRQHLCPSDKVQIEFNFIVADLTHDFSKEVKRSLKKSHIVTMFKFLSDVNDSSYSKSEIPDMINRIIESMSFKACLFYLDTSGGGLFNKMDKMIDKLPNSYRIYGPCLHNCHILNIDSVENFCDPLKRIFHFYKCTDRMKISCSAWIKVQHILNVNKLTHEISSLSIVPVLNDCKEQKLKKKKIKKIMQSAAKMKELVNDSASDVSSS